jgi:hypothetical protein
VNLWPSLLGATVTANAIVAPDGNTTADMVVEDTSTGLHRVVQSITLGGTVDSSPYTISVYAKAGTRSRFQFNDTTQGGALGLAIFDLAAGTVVSGVGTGTGTITNVGNGWYRCAVVVTKGLSVTGSPQIVLVSSGTTASYTGDGTSGLYVWGLQANLGSTALPYRSTTTAALWLPRFENDPITGAARGLMIEGGTTNVVTGSSSGPSITITTAAITSPTGVVDGIRALKSDTTTPRYFRWATTVTPTVNTTYTASMFVKRGNVDMTTSLEYNDAANWGGVSWAVNFSVTATDVTVGATSGGANGTVQNVGNGWYRVTATFTTGATTPTANGFILCKVSGTTNDFIYFWGGQLEAQTFASSYIPTTTATVARGADSALMTGTNFSSWYNQSAGTVFISTQGMPSGWLSGFLYQIDNNSNAERLGIATNNSTSLVALNTDGNVGQWSITVTSVTLTSPLRVSYSYSAADGSAAYNGTGPFVATSGTLPTPTQISIGSRLSGNYINTTISRLAYWPTRLPNETLQALTT